MYEESQAEIERLKAFEDEIGTLREAQAAHNETRINSLGKATKKKINAIIEKMGVEDAYAVRDLLDELIPALSEPKPPNPDGGSRGDDKGRKEEYVGSDEHQKAVRKRFRR